uniref:Putative c2h2-type zn-finger protein n=1 Tax=Culex tarsalis TaxID=7177 RepID=A0A1Q3FIG5_CULTA
MENILLKEAIIMANSNNMCRLCLSANGITEPLCYDQRDQFLLQKIYECTTLQIAPLNGIPSSLCTICKARLDEFYQFRWQCIKNDEIIRRIADNFQKQPTSSDPPATDPHHSTPVSVTDQHQHHHHHHLVQNPKQEIIEPPAAPPPPPPQQIVHPNGELQISPVEQCYNPPEGGRRSDERDTYRHHLEQPVNQPSYGVDHHATQYGMGGAVHVGGEFPPETKYHPHSFGEFADFRRKRGRPPKQKYEPYHHHHPHPIVKYGESSTDSKEDGSGSSTTATGLAMEEPELSYGAGSSRAGGDYFPHGTWPPQMKIKLEQMEHQQQQQQPPSGPYGGQMSPVPPEGRLPLTSTTQTLLTPEGFVKRSRGRPPREGGCPNQDRTEYRFQCQFCEARFKAAINLKLHTNTHTGERPYKCQLCDKSFAHPSNLSVHTKLHTAERVKREGQGAVPPVKKFQCPYCHTLFALAFQLKIHINTHTGQKPYVCRCGKGFAQPSNLHVHVKKHCHKRMEAAPIPLQPEQPQPQHYQPLPVPVPMPPQSPKQEAQPQQQQLHSPPPDTAQAQPHPVGGLPPVMMA